MSAFAIYGHSASLVTITDDDDGAATATVTVVGD